MCPACLRAAGGTRAGRWKWRSRQAWIGFDGAWVRDVTYQEDKSLVTTYVATAAAAPRAGPSTSPTGHPAALPCSMMAPARATFATSNLVLGSDAIDCDLNSGDARLPRGTVHAPAESVAQARTAKISFWSRTPFSGRST